MVLLKNKIEIEKINNKTCPLFFDTIILPSFFCLDGELLLLKLEDATFYYFIFRFYFILNTTIMENIFLPMTHRIVRMVILTE